MTTDYIPAKVPLAGQVISVVLQMSTFGVLSICILRRTECVQKWTSLPLAMWLIIVIYCDSALFVFATAIVVHGLGINASREICHGGILLCLISYMTTKILIYCFLVEKVYIVRGSMKPRLQTKMWLFNCLFMLLPYTIFVVLNFIYRITYINDRGICIIGMQKIAMLPLISFEVIVNVYLTILFIIPLRSMYSYKHNQNPALRRIAFRSFVGSCATLTTSVANLTVLMVLKGEPGWICLMCCNADILFCVLVLHWVTSKDKTGTPTNQNTFASLSRSNERSTTPTPTPRHSSNADATARKKKASPVVSSDGKQSSTITMECKTDVASHISKLGRLHHKTHPIVRIKAEDEMELHELRVQTVHAREAEQEGMMSKRSGSTMSRDEEWVGVERRVVGEKLV